MAGLEGKLDEYLSKSIGIQKEMLESDDFMKTLTLSTPEEAEEAEQALKAEVRLKCSQEVEALYNVADADGDGSLDQEECLKLCKMGFIKAKAVAIDAVTEMLGKMTLPLAQQLTPVLQQQLQPAGIEVSVDDTKHFVTIAMNTVMPALIDAIGAMYTDLAENAQSESAKVFEMMDKNGDGRVDRDEFTSGFEKATDAVTESPERKVAMEAAVQGAIQQAVPVMIVKAQEHFSNKQ